MDRRFRFARGPGSRDAVLPTTPRKCPGSTERGLRVYRLATSNVPAPVGAGSADRGGRMSTAGTYGSR